MLTCHQLEIKLDLVGLASDIQLMIMHTAYILRFGSLTRCDMSFRNIFHRSGTNAVPWEQTRSWPLFNIGLCSNVAYVVMFTQLSLLSKNE